MFGGRRRGPVGTMFPQPTVMVAGSPGSVLLDEVLGDGFVVIGKPAAVQESWPGAAVRRIAVHPAGSAPALGENGIVDVGGSLMKWLHRHGADVAVLRPDRFVYATATVGEMEGVRRRLVADLACALTPWRLTFAHSP